MSTTRPDADAYSRLKSVGLRSTRQRLALARLLFGKGHRHVSAESLHGEAIENRVRVSLATVYNTLHQFTKAGLLREVLVDSGRSFFDTNTSAHHHFLFEDSGRLQDIPAEQVKIERLPEAPKGTAVRRVDVVVRLRGSNGD